MSKYTAHILTGEYYARQRRANELGADVFLAQHVNSSVSESPDYGLGVVADNASRYSKELAEWYAKEAGSRFDVGGPLDHDVGYDNGVRIGGRGQQQIRHTRMPAVILEPWFASNPTQARRMNTIDGMRMGAELLRDLVVTHFPHGAIVGLSVGHLGQKSRPNDLGAPIVGGGWEATWANTVVAMAKDLLEDIEDNDEGDGAPPSEKLERVIEIHRPGLSSMQISAPQGTTITIT